MNLPKFSSMNNDPTRVFSSMHKQLTIPMILDLKRLRIEVDSSNGHLRSKDGRKNNPNAALAEALSVNYEYYEPLHVTLRRFSASAQNAGTINYSDMSPIRPNDVLAMIADLHKAGIINRYTLYGYPPYGNSIYILLNPIAKKFYDKEFAQIHLVKYINSHKAPNEIYYDCVLSDTYGSDHYAIDVLYRIGETANFVITALSQKMMLPAQIERITRLANRLKSLTVIVSPSINSHDLRMQIGRSINSRVNMKIVPYNKLYML